MLWLIIRIAALITALVTSAAAEECTASWYDKSSGSKTASGQRLNERAYTIAHKSLPFGTRVRITNKANGKTVIAVVNDRGPFISGRCVDATPATARALGLNGLARVSISRE